MENIKNFLQNINPRKYQEEIYYTCKEKNCLVVLPTGIGKTLVALMLSIDRLSKFPDQKVLFMAPTRPLAEQHLNYFKKYLPELFASMELFTGKTPSSKRKKLWQNSEIIFSTPQCISNDLKNNLYSLQEASLLIEDECHRCIKNYSYTFVAKKYLEQSKNPRILGLTASPGHEKEKIKTICKNLNIEAVELRTRESEDVKEYLQDLKFEIIKLEFPENFKKIKDLLLIIYNKKIQELKNRKLLFGYATKTSLLELQKRIFRVISQGQRHFNIFAGASACAQAIKLQHLIELLETQTLSSTLIYFQDLFEQASQQKSKAVSQLINKKEFNLAYTKLVNLISKKIEHPKLEKLTEIIKKEFKNKSKKVIVFAQYRDTVTKIAKTLNTILGINARVFVGQAKKPGKGKNPAGTGLSQKEQQELIREFSLGKVNVLCSTSVHPDEYIILKKGDKITIKKIGDFVDFFVKDNGKSSISKKIIGWEALTTNGEKILFKPITYVHKHLTQNNINKIILNSGFDTYVTENHSLFTFNSKNKFVPTIAEQDKFIAFALKCPNVNSNIKIDTIKEIYENCSEKELEKLFGSLQGLTQARTRMLKTDYSILSKLSKKLSISEITKLSKRDYSTVINCLRRLKKQSFIMQRREKRNNKNISIITELGLEYLEFLEWFLKSVKYRKGKYRFKLKSIPKEEFNKFFKQTINVNYGKTKFSRILELNESLARFLGFYVSEGSTRKTKSTSDVFLAARNKEMQKMMKEAVEEGLKLKSRVNKFGVGVDSQIAYHLIKYVFKAGIGAYNKEVPETIFTAPNNIKWEFLKAYFLGDGYSDNKRIVLTTVSRKLVVGLVLLLRMLGINKITLHQQKHIYRLYIHESLPFAKIREKNRKRRHAYFSLIPSSLSSKKAFDKYKNHYINSTSCLKCRKNGRWNSDVCFDYIKKIENIEKSKYVYDLSVKDTENFVGGTGLFCLHNSIGEEGLDIPEVHMVIFYEPIPSAIRQIQRRGRTARLQKGKLIILLTKNTRDEAYYWAAFNKEKKMYKSIDSIKQDFENGEINNKNNKSKQETLF